jgi:hypothetical protein
MRPGAAFAPRGDLMQAFVPRQVQIAGEAVRLDVVGR